MKRMFYNIFIQMLYRRIGSLTEQRNFGMKKKKRKKSIGRKKTKTRKERQEKKRKKKVTTYFCHFFVSFLFSFS